MGHSIDLEKLLYRAGLTKPKYHLHTIPYHQQTYYECTLELPELYLQESCIAATASLAKQSARQQAIQSILSLKLLPLGLINKVTQQDTSCVSISDRHLIT